MVRLDWRCCQTTVTSLEPKVPAGVVTNACTVSGPLFELLYLNAATPLTSVVAVAGVPALGPERTAKRTTTPCSGSPQELATVACNVAVSPSAWVWVCGASVSEAPGQRVPIS